MLRSTTSASPSRTLRLSSASKSNWSAPEPVGLDQVLGQLDAPPTAQLRLGVVGHPGVRLGVEAEEVGEDLRSRIRQKMSIRSRSVSPRPTSVWTLTFQGPKISRASLTTSQYLAHDRPAPPAGTSVRMLPEQVLGHGVEPDADHVDAGRLEALHLGAVERRRRHEDRQRRPHLGRDAGGDVEGVPVGVGVGHHRDAQPGHRVLPGGHTVDEFVGPHQRPLHPDERLVLVGAGAGPGQTAVSAVGPAPVLVVEEQVHAAELEVPGEAARPEPQGDGRRHRDPHPLGALVDAGRARPARRQGSQGDGHDRSSGK